MAPTLPHLPMEMILKIISRAVHIKYVDKYNRLCHMIDTTVPCRPFWTNALNQRALLRRFTHLSTLVNLILVGSGIRDEVLKIVREIMVHLELMQALMVAHSARKFCRAAVDEFWADGDSLDLSQ